MRRGSRPAGEEASIGERTSCTGAIGWVGRCEAEVGAREDGRHAEWMVDDPTVYIVFMMDTRTRTPRAKYKKRQVRRAGSHNNSRLQRTPYVATENATDHAPKSATQCTKTSRNARNNKITLTLQQHPRPSATAPPSPAQQAPSCSPSYPSSLAHSGPAALQPAPAPCAASSLCARPCSSPRC